MEAWPPHCLGVSSRSIIHLARSNELAKPCPISQAPWPQPVQPAPPPPHDKQPGFPVIHRCYWQKRKVHAINLVELICLQTNAERCLGTLHVSKTFIAAVADTPWQGLWPSFSYCPKSSQAMNMAVIFLEFQLGGYWRQALASVYVCVRAYVYVWNA